MGPKSCDCECAGIHSTHIGMIIIHALFRPGVHLCTRTPGKAPVGGLLHPTAGDRVIELVTVLLSAVVLV